MVVGLVLEKRDLLNSSINQLTTKKAKDHQPTQLMVQFIDGPKQKETL